MMHNEFQSEYKNLSSQRTVYNTPYTNTHTYYNCCMQNAHTQKLPYTTHAKRELVKNTTAPVDFLSGNRQLREYTFHVFEWQGSALCQVTKKRELYKQML